MTASHENPQQGSRIRTSPAWHRVVAVIGGLLLVASGVGAMIAPQPYFDAVAMFPPYNQHFIQDIGAFQIGLGAVLLLAAVLTDALAVALLGVGVGSAAHLVSHLVGIDLGGTPTTDLPLFAISTVVLLGTGAARWSDQGSPVRR